VRVLSAMPARLAVMPTEQICQTLRKQVSNSPTSYLPFVPKLMINTETSIQVSVYQLPLTNYFGIGQFDFLKPDNDPYLVHGDWDCPPGYKLIFVPYDAEVESLEHGQSCSMSCSMGYVKTLIALGQVLFAIATLYQSRGDQLSRFGYVSFGLTVIPYAVMSIVNLVGSLVRPEYPEYYMVESKILDEARKRGAKFHTVGRLVEDVSSSASEGSNILGLTQPARCYAEENKDNLKLEIHTTTNNSDILKQVSETVKEMKNNPGDDAVVSSNVAGLPREGQTLRLSRDEIDYNAAENTNIPTLLVPSTNPFRKIHSGKYTNNYEFGVADWTKRKGWDLTFLNDTTGSSRNLRGGIVLCSQLLVAGIHSPSSELLHNTDRKLLLMLRRCGLWLGCAWGKDISCYTLSFLVCHM